MPRARSSARLPVEMNSIGMTGPSPLMRMTEPLPNCFSICSRATSSAFSRSPTGAARPLAALARLEAAMRIATRRLLLPLVAVLAAVAILGVVVVLTREDRLAEAGSGAAAVGAASGQVGTPGAARQGTAVPGDPAGNPATAGLPRVVGTVATTDLVMIWNRDELGLVPARSRPGTGAQLR